MLFLSHNCILWLSITTPLISHLAITSHDMASRHTQPTVHLLIQLIIAIVVVVLPQNALSMSRAFDGSLVERSMLDSMYLQQERKALYYKIPVNGETSIPQRTRGSSSDDESSREVVELLEYLQAFRRDIDTKIPGHGTVVDVSSPSTNTAVKTKHSAGSQPEQEAVAVNHMLTGRSGCRAFAEQSCMNPELDEMPDTQRLVERASDTGLAGNTHRLSVEQCREETCDAEACADVSKEIMCRGCLQNCFRYCLYQHELLCMKRLCASSVLAAVDSFVKTVGAGHGPWAGKGKALAKAIGVPFATLQGQEITETAKWVHQIMDRDVTHPQCSDQHTADNDATGYLHKLVTCSHNSPQEALKRTADGTLEPRVLCEDMPEKSVADGGTPVNFTAIAERRSHRLWADMSRDALKFQV